MYTPTSNTGAYIYLNIICVIMFVLSLQMFIRNDSLNTSPYIRCGRHWRYQ